MSLANTEKRLLVATQRAIASAQCHKGTFLLEKQTPLFLALLAAFGGRPGDVYHSGTMLHLLLLVLVRLLATPRRQNETSEPDKQAREQMSE